VPLPSTYHRAQIAANRWENIDFEESVDRRVDLPIFQNRCFPGVWRRFQSGCKHSVSSDSRIWAWTKRETSVRIGGSTHSFGLQCGTRRRRGATAPPPPRATLLQGHEYYSYGYSTFRLLKNTLHRTRAIGFGLPFHRLLLSENTSRSITSVLEVFAKIRQVHAQSDRTSQHVRSRHIAPVRSGQILENHKKVAPRR